MEQERPVRGPDVGRAAVPAGVGRPAVGEPGGVVCPFHPVGTPSLVKHLQQSLH